MKEDKVKTIILKAVGLLAVLVLSTLVACGGNQPSEQEKATAYCLEQGGVITNAGQTCQYQEVAQFDDGVTTFTHNCELMAFYQGTCDQVSSSDVCDFPPLQEPPNNDPTVRQKLYSRVDDILTHLDNTGYAHNRDNNFSLVPGIETFPFADGTFDSYNLFLDCSGFVGYYVLQSIAKPLYTKIQETAKYSCDRPLAADFAEAFATASNSFTEATQTDVENNNVCWGRVKHLGDAKPGDIIVYKHAENFGDETKTCKDGRTITLAKCTDRDKDDKCTSRKNTGHILYILEKPYPSKHCKDEKLLWDEGCYSSESLAAAAPGEFQWVVKVADSTTSLHTSDSRALGEDKSHYAGNLYHAWSKTYDGVSDLYRCCDGSYHRSCAPWLGGKDCPEKIVINTLYEKNPTGIGAGGIYVNDAMDGFRSKYGSNIESADVYMGRPAKCDSLGK